jgi:hypothetical protein
MIEGANDSQRLFSPYVQTEIGRRQGGKGSGLGLALVRQIVRLSNGRLGVDSEYGKGSVFWFELPYAIPVQKTKSKPRDMTSPATRPPMVQGVSTIDEESMSGSMVISPAMEKDDPLDRIECRGSEGMPLTPLPPLGGFGQPGRIDQGGREVGGQGQGQGGQDHADRPKMQETESSMPLLSRTPSGRIRRESGMSLLHLHTVFHIPLSSLELLLSLLRLSIIIIRAHMYHIANIANTQCQQRK